MSQPYIMTWENADPNSLRLTGPFKSDGEAAAWGGTWERRDPAVSDLLWQLIYVDPAQPAFHAVPIETPAVV